MQCLPSLVAQDFLGDGPESVGEKHASNCLKYAVL